MAEPTLRVEASEALQRLSRLEGRRILERLLGEAGRLLVEEARRRAPVRTGRLRRSIIARLQGGRVLVGPTVPYAAYVEFGVRPHPVEAKAARALHFTVGGEEVFARRVHHPGFPGKRFMAEAGRQAIPKLRRLMARILEEAVRG